MYAIDTSKTLSTVIVFKSYVCNTSPNLWPFAAVSSTICANLYLFLLHWVLCTETAANQPLFTNDYLIRF